MSNLEHQQLTHDRLAERFDALMNPYDIQRRLEVLIQEFLGAVDLENKLVLDAGCGTGRGTSQFLTAGAKVISLDIGMNLLKYTEAHYEAVAVNGSVLVMPFEDNTFDIVFSTEVIEHTPDPEAAILEMVRVLKPQGFLVLSTPNWLWQFPVRLASQLKLRPYDGIENFMKPSELRSVLQRTHGQIVEHRGIHLIPFQLKALQGISRFFDQYGKVLLPVMINQAICYQKR